MPHIIVEHTKDIKHVPQLLKDLHDSLAGQDTVDLNSIKTRAVAIEPSIIGGGTKTSMVHVTLRLLSGRSDNLLNKITSALHGIVINHCGIETCATVESVDLYRPSYKN